MKRLKHKGTRKISVDDAIAGLTVSLVNIPKAMGYSIVATINPLHGLYSAIIPTILAAVFASSTFMVVSLTNETALMTAALISGLGTPSMEVIFMFTVMVGLWLLFFGVLKLGTFLRFVSQSVMTGFVAGTAVLVILGQIGKLVGVHSEYHNPILATGDILFNPGSWDIASTITGISMIALIIIFHKTRFKKVSLIIALFLTSLGVWITRLSSVKLVGDEVSITPQLPFPIIPDFTAIPDLLLPSFATAVLCVALAAGVSQNFPNPDGSKSDPNRDFLGIGAANLVGGIFQAGPSTASLGATAANVEAGAKSRSAAIISGLLVAVMIMTIVSLLNMIPMPALAGLLIFVGFEAINERRIMRAWEAHLPGRIGMVVTFVLTLMIPLVQALLAGIILSLALYIFESSRDVRVREVVIVEEGRFREQSPPARFPSNQVTVLSFYGSPFFAAIEVMEKKLPSIEGGKNAVVIFLKRGTGKVNNTYLTWLQWYAKKLEESGNRLFMAEVEPHVREAMEKTGVLKTIGEDAVFPAQPVIGASIDNAIAAANRWIRQQT